MNTEFIVRGYHAFSEQDNYENGCDGPSKSEFIGGLQWQCRGKTLTELIANLSSEFCANNIEDFLLDSCDEPGRLDLQVDQKIPFVCAKPSAKTLQSWKDGKLDLWLTCYTFKVEQLITEFSLTGQLTNEGT